MECKFHVDVWISQYIYKDSALSHFCQYKYPWNHQIFKPPLIWHFSAHHRCVFEQHQFETLLIITHLARMISKSLILNLSDLLHYKCVYVYIFSWISRISTFVPFSTFCLWAIVQLCTCMYLFVPFLYSYVHIKTLNTFRRSWSCFLINKRCKCSLYDKYSILYIFVYSMSSPSRDL